MSRLPPVITIDGPTASGKGTIAQRVAAWLGYRYLDSGALYRLLAMSALARRMSLDDADALARMAVDLRPLFEGDRIRLDGTDVTDAIRAEDVGRAASQLAVHPPVRAALLDLQRSFRMPPGLVADGRDMGTVVFPDARLKVFLTATVAARADRRHKQLMEKGISTNIHDLSRELEARDQRDIERAAAPLRPAEDAYQLDSSALSIDEVVHQVLDWYGAASDRPAVQ
jgi:cytidylate kinase